MQIKLEIEKSLKSDFRWSTRYTEFERAINDVIRYFSENLPINW